jgi:hypothetical protein
MATYTRPTTAALNTMLQSEDMRTFKRTSPALPVIMRQRHGAIRLPKKTVLKNTLAMLHSYGGKTKADIAPFIVVHKTKQFHTERVVSGITTRYCQMYLILTTNLQPGFNYSDVRHWKDLNEQSMNETISFIIDKLQLSVFSNWKQMRVEENYLQSIYYEMSIII